MSVDTLSLARELRAADFANAQVEAIAAAIGRAVIETAATRSDLLQVETLVRADIGKFETTLRAEIGKLDAKLDAKIESLRSTMLLWFIGTTITLAALMLAALKL